MIFRQMIVDAQSDVVVEMAFDIVAMCREARSTTMTCS